MNESAIDAEGTSVPTETSSVTEEVTQATEEARIDRDRSKGGRL